MAEGVCRVCGTTTRSAERGGTIPVFCGTICKKMWDAERKRLERQVAWRLGVIADYEAMLAYKPHVAKPALKHHRKCLDADMTAVQIHDCQRSD